MRAKEDSLPARHFQRDTPMIGALCTSREETSSSTQRLDLPLPDSLH